MRQQPGTKCRHEWSTVHACNPHEHCSWSNHQHDQSRPNPSHNQRLHCQQWPGYHPGMSSGDTHQQTWKSSNTEGIKATALKTLCLWEAISSPILDHQQSCHWWGGIAHSCCNDPLPVWLAGGLHRVLQLQSALQDRPSNSSDVGQCRFGNSHLLLFHSFNSSPKYKLCK